MTYDLVETIYKHSGALLQDSDGNEYPEMIKAEGYHVNCLELSEEELEKVTPFIIDVLSPSRIFAGREDTVYLKFADRDKWLSLGFEKIEDEELL